ncbi:MAG: Gfo/Idh/MocA family oxidoreductase [Atopobiaceae bacterium]|nr:Gfo/Idh/MocA family oxidoreductase [Atopobiaceae bacterium]
MVRWAILGAGNIARRFAASLDHVEGAQLVAASCRSAEKARAFLDAVPCAEGAQAYGNYDALLADERIDAIYLALPHEYHYEWAIKALQSGKAVLCEKPAMLSAAQMEEVARVARQTKTLFMEAMKPRFVPLYERVRQACSQIGAITRIEVTLCNDMLGFVEGTGTYHMTPGPGAGVLLDCGIYCASWLEDFLTGVPTIVGIAGQKKDEIDVYADANFACDGMTARLECAFDRAKSRTAAIIGENGFIVVDELHRPQHATLHLADGSIEELDAPYVVDDFYGEVSHFTQLVEEGSTESPLMTLDDSIGCARIIDAARACFSVTPAALDVLERQEQDLRYPVTFGADEALELGCAIARLAPEYDRGITAVITREGDGMQLFSWSMDDKAPRNYGFAEGKRQASLATGHASVWGYLDHQVNSPDTPLYTEQTVGLPAAGAFPICVGDERVATVCVSGLHEGRDHELVVRALQEVLGVTVSALPCVVI